MKTLHQIRVVFAGLLLVVSCSKETGKESTLETLRRLKTEKEKLETRIDSVKQKLVRESDTIREKKKRTLVTVEALRKNVFKHFIEVQGKVASDKNVMLSAETAARVTSIPVEEGDRVERGDLLVRLDASVLKRQIEEIRSSLDHARYVYQRRKNLREKDVGTEIEFRQAKQRKEDLVRKLQTARERLENTTITAPFSGTVDEINIKEGEMASPGMRIVRLVNLNDLYVTGDVSERYVGRVEKGDSVSVKLPSLGLEGRTTVRFTSQVINQGNRTFQVETFLPDDLGKNTRPNQMALLRIRDRMLKDVVTIPVNRVQHDQNGEYVFVVRERSAAKPPVVEKVRIKTGDAYEGRTVVQEGLKAGDKLVIQGFRDVEDDEEVKIVEST